MPRRTNTAVWMEKYKRWQINVQKDGERKTFYSSTPGRNGQRECNKKADEWLDAGLVNPNTKVEDLFTQFIESLKVTTSKDNWRQYEGFGRNWINPSIGHYKIGAVVEPHLRKIMDKAFEAGLSKKTLSNLKGCMTAFIKYARICKASTLIIEKLTVPRLAVAGERVILQPNDLIILFNHDSTIRRGVEVYELYINAYRFEVATGLRPGEVIGLMREDITGNMAHIKRSINRYGEETTGKNENARRSFALTDYAMGILMAQMEKLKELGIKSDYVFPNEYGEPIRQATYYKRWIVYRNASGMSSQASPYELRHTFVSVVKRLPPGLLKPLVGHSKDMDTYGTYSHEVAGDMTETAAIVQALFQDALKQAK